MDYADFLLRETEKNISASIDDFDDEFLESLREINGDSVGDDFLNAMDEIVKCSTNVAHFTEKIFDPFENSESHQTDSITENNVGIANSDDISEYSETKKVAGKTNCNNLKNEGEKNSKKLKNKGQQSLKSLKNKGENDNDNLPSKELSQNIKLPPMSKKVSQGYRDFSEVSDEEANLNNKHTDMRGRTQKTFQMKLHAIIERSDIDGYSHIISWAENGRSFRIHNHDLFLEKVVRRFFFQTVLSSFMRQLAMYGFHKIVGKNNSDRGNFFHELFLRGRPGLCAAMVRLGSRKRKIIDAKNEPDLSLYKPMPIPDLKKINYENSTALVSSTNSHPKEVHYTVSSGKHGPGRYFEKPQKQVMSTSTNNIISYVPIVQSSIPAACLPNSRLAIDKASYSSLNYYQPQVVGVPIFPPLNTLIRKEPIPTNKQSSQYPMSYIMMRPYNP